MKKKYLSLALATVVAGSLTACGSDSNSNYDKYPVADETPDTSNPNNAGDTPGTGTPSVVDGTPAGDKPNGEETPVNPTAPSVDQPNDPTAVLQQYRRGTNSKFDREFNKVSTNTGNTTVASTLSIQNKSLDNIVVGRETPIYADKTTGNLKRYVGKGKNGVTFESENSTNSLQSHNSDNNVDVTSNQVEDTGLVYINNTATTGTVGLGTSVAGSEATSTKSTRIFGNKYRNENNSDNNTHQVKGIVGKDGKFTTRPTTLAGNVVTVDKAVVTQPKLNYVQYGRVTSNIDPIKTPVKGKFYESKLVGTNGSGRDPSLVNNSQVDTYFARGLNETTLKQMADLKTAGGSYIYNGHALMYGLDNNYHAANAAGDTNSFGGGDKANYGLGNFVTANVNMADQKVTGSVFNVWDITPSDRSANYSRKDDLVKFTGNIKGNAVDGVAVLAYTPAAGVEQTGSFDAAFFGPKAEELGGTFNSVKENYKTSQ